MGKMKIRINTSVSDLGERYIHRLPPLPDALSVLAHGMQHNYIYIYIYIYIQQKTCVFSEQTAATIFLQMIEALLFEAVLLFLPY